MGAARYGSIAIVTDATADVPRVEREAIDGVPWVVLAETWHADPDVDIVDDGTASLQLADLVLSGMQPEPSEPRWDDFTAAFHRLREVERVFSIHSPRTVSNAALNAREAAGAYPNVRVIEASVTGIGLGLLATLARDRAAAGAGPDEVETWLREHRDSVRMLVVPDRFDPTTSQRGVTARMLAGRPMLQTSATSIGSLDRSRRLRSRRATVAAIERYFTEHTSAAGVLRMALAHGDAAGAVDPFLDLLERIRPVAEVALVGRVGPRLLKQLGSRCVAAAWLEEASPNN